MAVTDTYALHGLLYHPWRSLNAKPDRLSRFQNTPNEHIIPQLKKENSWPTSHEVVPQKGWKRRRSDQCRTLSSFTKRRKLSCLEGSMTQRKHPFPDEVTDLVQGPKKERPKKKIAQSQEMAMEMDIGFVQSALLRPFGGYSTFQEKLKVTSAGLTHHCSQYGVTLSIPEGAVEQPANVTFDACLYSIEFNFGKYVPVTPIVRVHVDTELKKPAELYLPHHVDDTDPVTRSKLILLTANDDSKSFTPENKEIAAESGLCRISCHHFCSSCVAIDMTEDKNVTKEYIMVRAEKKESNAMFVHFCIFPFQAACKKLVEQQFSKLNFEIKDFKQVALNGGEGVTVTFDPDETAGWKRISNGTNKISEENANYFEVMKCKGIPVTKDGIQKLKMMEDMFLYPPRFCFEFSCTDTSLAQPRAEVTANLTGQLGPLQCRIPLSIDEAMSLVPATGWTSPISSPSENSITLAKILSIVVSGFKKESDDKWHPFGLALGLNFYQLETIEKKEHTHNYVRAVLHLRYQNHTITWEPVAKALKDIELKKLAKDLEHSFTNTEEGSTTETMPAEVTNQLEIKDLVKVLRVLREVQFSASKWEDLGLELGLYQPTLDGISGSDDKERLQKTIRLWLECQDGVKDEGGPTWKNLTQSIKNTGNIAAGENVQTLEL